MSSRVASGQLGATAIVIKDSRVANRCMPERVDGLLLLGGPLEDEAPPVEMGAVPQGLHRALSLGRRLYDMMEHY